MKPGPKTDSPVKRRSFACTDEEWEMLTEYANEKGWSTSKAIRHICQTTLKRRGRK